MSAVIDPYKAHANLRGVLGNAAAGDAFLEMARSYEPDHTLSARGIGRAIHDVAYDLDIFPQVMTMHIPVGAELQKVEPYVKGLLSALQSTAVLYEEPAYREFNNPETPRGYHAAIESAWTKVLPAPSV